MLPGVVHPPADLPPRGVARPPTSHPPADLHPVVHWVPEVHRDPGLARRRVAHPRAVPAADPRLVAPPAAHWEPVTLRQADHREAAAAVHLPADLPGAVLAADRVVLVPPEAVHQAVAPAADRRSRRQKVISAMALRLSLVDSE